LLEVTRHANKLRIGHLAGNRFRIRLVGIEPQARAGAAALCQRVAEQGIGNYFGSQRFGLGQRNLETALTLLERGDWDRARGSAASSSPGVIQSEIFNRYLMLRSARGARAPARGRRRAPARQPRRVRGRRSRARGAAARGRATSTSPGRSWAPR
jgi:tRNA pseudouridine13 synthase